MLFLKTYDDVLKYEKGIRKPNVEIVKRLVEILGVSKE
ncbi:MAG: helix-turn-helix transcriptional regulator [Erysipelotrichaceae bacterium]|nr:helix-turn-helix transcriptional regulator [Erysipelotrichaceae bacterium]